MSGSTIERPPTSGETPPENNNDTSRNPHDRRERRPARGWIIGGSAATAALATALIVGPNVIGQNNNEPTKEKPVATAPVDPSEAPVEPAPSEAPVDTPEQNPGTESIAVSAELINDPEALTAEMVERTSAWLMAGATPENAQLAYDSDDLEGYAKKVAAEESQKFIDELLVADWQSNALLKAWVEEWMIPHHENSLFLYFATSRPDLTPEDIEPYVRERNLDEVLVVQPLQNGVGITSYESDSDNADQNSVGEYHPNSTRSEGSKDRVIRSIVTEDGKAKIAEIVVVYE